MKPAILALLIIGSVLACSARDSANSTVTGTTRAAPLSAYLIISSAPLVAGDDVTVDIALNREAGAPLIGSYLMDIDVDTAAVRLLTATSADGIVAANTIGTGIRVAGATGSSFQSARLGSFTFKVRDPAAVRSMTLRINELNSSAFADQRPNAAVAPLAFEPVHPRASR